MSSFQAYSAVDMPIENHSPGSLFMVMAPSGAGKSTLVSVLLAQDSSIHLPVSATMHKPRPGEQHGREYNFMIVEEFKACRDRGEFLEWAEIHGNYCAAPRMWIEEQICAGIDVLLEIDWQGAQQVYQCFSDAIGIFILSPSLPVLEGRLKKCDQDELNVIVCRLLAAGSEMVHTPKADYVITNEVLDTTLAELRTVVQAMRPRFGTQKACHGELFIESDVH